LSWQNSGLNSWRIDPRRDVGPAAYLSHHSHRSKAR
jgi:hypothetical protein